MAMYKSCIKRIGPEIMSWTDKAKHVRKGGRVFYNYEHQPKRL